MRCRALLLGLLSGAMAIAACDTGDEPRPVSTFAPEVPLGRQILGHVLAGSEPVAGALVRVDPSPRFTSDATLGSVLDGGVFAGDGGAVVGDLGAFSRVTTTDMAGGYRVQFAPFVYDLSLRHDRDVLVLRAAEIRAFDVPFLANGTISGFHALVQPTIDPPPAAGHSVAFFVSGDDARASSLVAGSGAGIASLDVTFRRYDSNVILSAVEYVTAGGPAAAVAESHVMLRVRSGDSLAPVLPTKALDSRPKVTFSGAVPAGFTLDRLDVVMDMGVRYSSVPVAEVALGVPLEIAIVYGARYLVRGRATRGDEVSTTGLVLFNSYDASIPILFPPPAAAEAPPDGKVGLGTSLAVDITKGVVEHSFTPVSGEGATIRVVTSERTTTLPDVTVLGLPHPTGRYTWTVEHFAALLRVDRLNGADGRVSAASWKSAPAVVTLE